MKDKLGNYKMAYNMQSAVDSETGLICAITISQSPTDHYELPSIVTKAINNIGKKPEYVSTNHLFTKSQHIIPNRTKNKLINTKQNTIQKRHRKIK